MLLCRMVEEDVKEMTKDEYLLSVIRIMTVREFTGYFWCLVIHIVLLGAHITAARNGKRV